MPHRALEAAATTRMVQRIFADAAHFTVHAALPAHLMFADEGGANHMRMSAGPGAPGVEIYVHGPAEGARFPCRQTRAASEAIARRHGIGAPIFAGQAQAAIDAGAFHNDVVAVAHENVLLFHEHAFSDKQGLLRAITLAAEGLFEPLFIEIAEADLPLAAAVSSYLFNSQIVSPPGADRMTLILPEEAREDDCSRAAIERIAQSNGPIGGFEYLNLHQSMRNGGGPACLRLRVELTDVELAAATPGFMLTPTLIESLECWVRRHYRETLAPAELAEPALITETRAALDELTRVLPLGSDFYDFQRT